MSDSISRPKAATAVWSALKLLLVFGALGPLIGLVVFAVGISLITVAGGQPDGIWLAPFFLLYGFLFAHLVGLPWALVAGVAAFMLSLFAGARSWIGVASGGVSFAIAAAGGFVELPSGPDTAVGATIDTFGTTFAGLMAAVHVVSGCICWLIARPLVRT